MESLINDSNRTKTVYAIVLRVQEGTTFEQQLSWQPGEHLYDVLDRYQEDFLGSRKVYKVIDWHL